MDLRRATHCQQSMNGGAKIIKIFGSNKGLGAFYNGWYLKKCFLPP